MYEDILPDNFECYDMLPPDECGALNGKITYVSPDYSCRVCGFLLKTDSDIEGDSIVPDSDGDAADDDDGDDTPIAPLDEGEKENSPREAMVGRVYTSLRGTIEDLLDLETPALDFFATYFARELDSLVSFYMLFTKYGPYKKYDMPSTLKDVVISTSIAYMMINEKQVRFSGLAKYLNTSEKSLLIEASILIRIHTGEDFHKGAYLVGIYVRAFDLPDHFSAPAQQTWKAVTHPIGNLLDRVIAFVGAYANLTDQNISISQLSRLSGITRTTLSHLMKEYEERIPKAVSP